MTEREKTVKNQVPAQVLNRRLIWLRQNWQLYGMLLLPAVYYVLFKYVPMYGTLIAFKKYSPRKGVWGSQWVGLENFRKFLEDPYFY